MLGVTVLIASAPASDDAWAKSCGRFIVGEANSTAYPGLRLPARGSVERAACSTLRRVARRLHDGSYVVPDAAQSRGSEFGSSFTVRDNGRKWSCRLRHEGGSGPTYEVRCRRAGSRLRWKTG